MVQTRTSLLALGIGTCLLAACGGSSSGDGPGGPLGLIQVSNGFGQILPHTTFKLGPDNQPTTQVISIRTEQDLLDNVRLGNPVRPVPTFDPGPLLPSGAPGNHFLYVTFDRPIDIDSVLSPSPGQAGANGLTGALTVVALDPSTGSAAPIKGRAFVNGQTYAGELTGSPPQLQLQTWVTRDPTTGVPVVNMPEGLGFPGTETLFQGANELVSPNTFVFVVDSDQDLTNHEAFPANRHIRMQITTAVRSTDGQPLGKAALASTTVGTDTLAPEIQFAPPPLNTPQVIPGGGQTGVDPLTTIRVELTEPVQPWSVGDLPLGGPPTLSAAFQLSFGPPTSNVDMPFHAMPLSVFDLSTYVLTPAFNFPGEGPNGNECGLFNEVRIQINAGQMQDLSSNSNTQGGNTNFFTGPGPGIVNTPVAPEAIYVGRTGFNRGISVIDMNGFGASTGNPTFSETNIQEGNSNYPNNANVKFQGSQLRPPLQAGSCTFDGGSAGVFTLTRDSALNDLVVRAPLLQQVADMHLGPGLDLVFNNGPVPFGCQAGGGNLCAITGKKQYQVTVTNATLSPVNINLGTTGGVLIDGGPNLVSWSPHPNPPPLKFPPLCVSPFLGGIEPTSVESALPLPPAPPPNGLGLVNLLVPGDAFGNPLEGVPPSGVLSTVPLSFFDGPSLPQIDITNCFFYSTRQQVGHFLYVIDRSAREVVVLNSNRMTVIDRIPLPDPTAATIATNLNLLAVTNQSIDTVSFINIDPASANFHKVVKTTSVGRSPRGIAWEPGDEDIFVTNELDNSVSILSAFSLEVRKVVSAFLDRPFAVAITPRQVNFGHWRNVYFAYVLNRSGRVAVFESGPDAVNGWGFDNFIGIAPQTFLEPKTIQPDHNDLRSAFWVVHQGPIDQLTGQPGPANEGAVTRCVVESAIFGQVFLNTFTFQNPQFRDMTIAMQVSIGQQQLSGVPVDIAFDDYLNVGGLPNWQTSFSAGSPVIANGKAIVRAGAAANRPRYLFAAIPNPTSGLPVIDVINLDTFVRFDTSKFHPGVQSIPVPDVTVLMDYFRQ